MTLIVKRVTTTEELEIAKALRWRVFIEEQGFDGDIEVDEYDAKDSTYHFIGKDVEQDKYVAVARVLMYPAERKAKIGRVAVLAECRGKQYGVALMSAVEQAVVDDGIELYALSAQYDKKGFYERCGYACASDEIYLEEGVKHCMMTKKAVKAAN
ncbi:hypothetical protein PybrP1_000850 [[Pythium] brassicae (nom. inval.)]|nr:hypothetical protein PybrP1_000850 [[Pythium] brassicae (nom. inval.)]